MCHHKNGMGLARLSPENGLPKLEFQDLRALIHPQGHEWHWVDVGEVWPNHIEHGLVELCTKSRARTSGKPSQLDDELIQDVLNQLHMNNNPGLLLFSPLFHFGV